MPHQLFIESLVEDIVSSNPSITPDGTIELLERGIVEVIPHAVMEVELDEEPLTPFEIRRREFLSKRRPRSRGQEQEYITDYDPEHVIRSARSFYRANYGPKNGSMWYEPVTQYSGDTIMETEETYMLEDSSAANRIQELVAEKNLINATSRNFQDIILPSSGKIQELFLPSGFKRSISRKTSYDSDYAGFVIDDQLMMARDISMPLGRLFSIIETESIDFARERQADISFKLMARNPNASEVSHNNRGYKLEVKSSTDIPNIDLQSLSMKLEERIRDKLEDSFENLSSYARKEFAEISNNLLIIPVIDTSLRRRIDAVNSLSRIKGQSLGFEQIRIICNLILTDDTGTSLSSLGELVEKDIENKRLRTGIDCRAELNKNMKLIGKSIDRKLENNYKRETEKLYHSIRSLLLFEYKRLSQIDESKFLNGSIDLNEYNSRNEYYTNVILDLW